ncbi:hypothetical protein PAHAL_4G016200 [Panicum hallii]|uniref:DUF8204 domain-containing protein n=1 Tax=Panicum hallii TaxID=206008 RepID=A0A2S3HGD7_9POAL|nr:uncharacterized protein LOC112888811 isoform X2 [Panicum hallii]PAN22386.1 hypothetical protein PAHAL_4G016200 [Panicum hallii]
MERAGGEAGDPTPPVPPPAAAGTGGAAKGRSCKGCLFYSSVLRSRARGPVCVGITRALPQVSERMIGEIELEAIQEGRNLSDFKYACVGYSIYLDDKETSMGVHDKKAHAQLPVCVGVELLADRRAPVNKAPSYNKKEAPQPEPQPHRYKPGHAGDDFLTKFQRNAGLVANGVAKNLNKVGTYIKDTMGDMMYPDRKRPK